MDKKKILKEIKRLEEIESSLLIKLENEAHLCTEDHLRFVTKKIFEVSNFILRLKEVLEELKNER